MLFFQARIDDIAQHPDLMGNLREVGTYWILCGVETNSEEMLTGIQERNQNTRCVSSNENTEAK